MSPEPIAVRLCVGWRCLGRLGRAQLGRRGRRSDDLGGLGLGDRGREGAQQGRGEGGERCRSSWSSSSRTEGDRALVAPASSLSARANRANRSGPEPASADVTKKQMVSQRGARGTPNHDQARHRKGRARRPIVSASALHDQTSRNGGRLLPIRSLAGVGTGPPQDCCRPPRARRISQSLQTRLSSNRALPLSDCALANTPAISLVPSPAALIRTIRAPIT